MEEDRLLQDVGLDGLSDEEERLVYPNGPANDPAGDNYKYFLQAEGGIIDRYRNYNGTDGNSPIAFSDTDRGSSAEPDAEDVNRDQTMNTIDSYFEYKIPIEKNMRVGGHPFVTDVRENVNVELPNGQTWLHAGFSSRFLSTRTTTRNQLCPYFNTINGIQDLRSVRFMRMVLSGLTTRSNALWNPRFSSWRLASLQPFPQ